MRNRACKTLFTAVALLSSAGHGRAQCPFGWLPGEEFGIRGTPPFVDALTVHNGELVAGGTFSTAGDIGVNKIARWNGTNWARLGNGIPGLNRHVDALAVFNGELIAAGRFSQAGTVSAANIAKWDGTSWAPLGSGTAGGGTYFGVEALTIFKGELIGGGHFTFAGGVNANNIARWNGTNWAALGDGIGQLGGSDWVVALAIYNDELIAGGRFTSAGSGPASRIARWDGTTWAPLGSGVNVDGVFALTIFEDQ